MTIPAKRRSRPHRTPALAAAACGLLLAGCATTPPASRPAATATPRSAGSPPPSPSAAPAAPDQRLEVPLPVPVEETAAGVAAGRLVVAGGLDAAGRDRADVWVLDGAAWQPGPRLPVAVDHAAAATIGSTLYVAGGFSAGVAVASVESWDGGPSWTRMPSLPVARGAMSLVAAGGMLIAAGGRGAAGEVAAVEAWTPGESGWHPIGSLPVPRDHLAGFTNGATVCFAGGRSPTWARVDCVDPASGAWSALAALPAPTSGAGAGTLAATPVVAGGELADESGGVTPWLWWLEAGTWRSARMLVPRHGWEGAVLGGRLWACGGGVAPGLHPTAVCTSIGFS